VAFQTPITISKALSRVHQHDYVLPAIQREFVWQTEQIVRLFDSLMLGYPIGSFLFWKVEKSQSLDFVFYDFMTDYHARSARHLKRLNIGEGRALTAVLDGQQRLTALNIGLRGSHAEKLPRKWVDSPWAYPQRFLYLNLVQGADENDLGMEYDFRFLTNERAVADSGGNRHWFPVTNIMKITGIAELFGYVQEVDLATNKFAFPALSRLHEVVHKDMLINYYEEEAQDLDKVLNIFIRVNSGGTQLSYSDLLLSIATAQWGDVEAREVIHTLVDELNETGQHFTLNKDIVLKAGLLLTDLPSIAFKVTNFNAANMDTLQRNWQSISAALRLAVRLLADFGFSDRTLNADSVVLPIAYYIHLRRLNENYLNTASVTQDREAIKGWVIKSLVKPGIWGSGLDTLLLTLRKTIQEYGQKSYPAAELESAMTRLGKSLRFDEDEIQDLLGLAYGDKRTFALLALLYPGMDFRNEFHLDHIVPGGAIKKSHLAAAGIDALQADELREMIDRLPNLQLLEGPYNVAKQDKMPDIWIAEHFSDEYARNSYCARHDLEFVPQNLLEFKQFYDARRDRLAEKLRKLLGAGPT
jgi:hypothetical protein